VARGGGSLPAAAVGGGGGNARHLVGVSGAKMGEKIKSRGRRGEKMKSGLDKIQIREWDGLVNMEFWPAFCGAPSAEQFHSTALQVLLYKIRFILVQIPPRSSL
jgi:hypothetical protein